MQLLLNRVLITNEHQKRTLTNISLLTILSRQIYLPSEAKVADGVSLKHLQRWKYEKGNITLCKEQRQVK